MGETRLEAAQALVGERGLDALLVTHPSNRFYLSGYSLNDIPPNESAGALLIGASFAYLIVSGTNENQARAEAARFEVVRRGRDLASSLNVLVTEGIRRLGFEESAINVSDYQAIAGLDGVELVPVGDRVSDLRLVKEASELALIEWAVAITDAAFDAVAPTLQPEMSEREAAWAFERALHDHGADGLAFPVIVAAGPNGAFAHHEPGDTLLGSGMPITIDLGARVGGYNADLTRTVILGEPEAQARTIYRTLMRAVDVAEGSIHAGMTGIEADATAREIIVAAGFGDYFSHGLGHGVGIRVHESPGAGPSQEVVLVAGATLTIEPGIYIPGWGGARIEDLVLIEERGVRVLSKASKQQW